MQSNAWTLILLLLLSFASAPVSVQTWATSADANVELPVVRFLLGGLWRSGPLCLPHLTSCVPAQSMNFSRFSRAHFLPVFSNTRQTLPYTFILTAPLLQAVVSRTQLATLPLSISHSSLFPIAQRSKSAADLGSRGKDTRSQSLHLLHAPTVLPAALGLFSNCRNQTNRKYRRKTEMLATVWLLCWKKKKPARCQHWN